jgi:putative tricarboxylic transport membrane protein
VNAGPLLFQTQANLVWGLIASLYIANVMLLVLNLPLVPLWVKILGVPKPWLYGGILLFATIGTYGISQSVIDLMLLYAVGIAGYFMRRFDFPAAPVIIGMILGPLAEQELRRALTISQGDWTVFLTRPLSATLLVLAAAALLGPHLYAYMAKRR